MKTDDDAAKILSEVRNPDMEPIQAVPALWLRRLTVEELARCRAGDLNLQRRLRVWREEVWIEVPAP